jgi:hypothetical protein
MKVTLDAKSFAEAIQWSTRALDSKNDKAYVAFVVDSKGNGFLSHLNSTSFLKAPFQVLEASIDEQERVEIALNGTYMSRLASSLDWSGPIDIESNKDKLTLKSRSGALNIPILTAKMVTEPKYEELGEVSGIDYFNAIQRLSKVLNVANSSLMPALGSLDINLDKETKLISIMGTDRYTLSEIILDFVPSTSADDFFIKKEHILLPHEAAVLVNAPKSDENVTIVLDDKNGKYGYVFPDGRIGLFSLKEADAFNYGSLKDKSSDVENSAKFDTTLLRKSVGIISSLNSLEESIYLEIVEGEVLVRDKSGENLLRIEAETEFEEEITIKFSLDTINRGFNGVLTPKMRLCWSNGAFAVLQSVNDKGDILETVFTIINASK